MKLLDSATKASVEGCAAAVIETAFDVVRLVRAEIHRSRPARLSLQQVRALGCVDRAAGASLSLVAEQLGLALPSASHLVDGLVRRGLLARRNDAADRRRIRLDLTARGTAALRRAMDLARTTVAERIAGLTASERRAVVESIDLLRPHLVNEAQPAE
jgi:DNA-binding MarR family transcriptional regulator